ncbi:MAG: ATP-binding protein [Actinobacteria bacterium]|nr:ATP-binding protein [Actinomycetota bacterium]
MGDEHAPEAAIELTLPSDPKYLALVRVVVAAVAGAVPALSDSRVADLKLVATELFANAMEANWRRVGFADAGPRAKVPESLGSVHPGGRSELPEGTPPVRVSCRADAAGVTLVIADSGLGLDASIEPHPPVGDPTRLRHERGLGIPLIQYLADEVDYASTPDGTSATAVLRDRRSGRRES